MKLRLNLKKMIAVRVQQLKWGDFENSLRSTIVLNVYFKEI